MTVPARIRQLLHRRVVGRGDAGNLARVRQLAFAAAPGSVMSCLDYKVRINDGPNYYFLYKDIFVKRIYHFESTAPAPRILDCGSNVGMSVLYFKHVYPQARITAFEPDPAIFSLLQGNIAANGLTKVDAVASAVGSEENVMTFHSDGKYSGYLAPQGGAVPAGWTEQQVPCRTLGAYLTDPVDFLKMNVEGAEFGTLQAVEQQLRQVQQMVIEFHHLPSLPRTLHSLLELLHRQGFEYLVNAFDDETNPGAHPPFKLDRESRYFLLIYAKRID